MWGSGDGRWEVVSELAQLGLTTPSAGNAYTGGNTSRQVCFRGINGGVSGGVRSMSSGDEWMKPQLESESHAWMVIYCNPSSRNVWYSDVTSIMDVVGQLVSET